MSLPNETVFKCAGHSSSEGDKLIVDYGNEDHLYLSTIEHGEGRADVILSKDQVQSLRDQLTAWLGDRSDSGKLIDLLQRVYEMDLAERHLQPFNRSKLMDDIESVLSASAEPSAPNDCAICHDLGSQCMECEEGEFREWADRHFAAADYRKTDAGVFIKDWMRHAYSAWCARGALETKP